MKIIVDESWAIVQRAELNQDNDIEVTLIVSGREGWPFKDGEQVVVNTLKDPGVDTE